MFRNKILFYLWNDVCKDGDADIFPMDTDFSFSKLYDEDCKQLIISMMDKLGLKPIDKDELEIMMIHQKVMTISRLRFDIPSMVRKQMKW